MNRITNMIKRLAEVNEEKVDKLTKFFVENADSPAVEDLCEEWLDDSFLWDDYFDNVDGVTEEYDDTEDATKKVVAKEYYSAEDAMDFFINGNISYSLDTDFEDGTIDEIFNAFPEDIKEMYNGLSSDDKQALIDKLDNDVFSKESGKNRHGFSFVVNHCSADAFDKLFDKHFDEFVSETEN